MLQPQQAERPHPVIPTDRWEQLHPSVQRHPCDGPIVYVVTNALACHVGLPQVVKIGTTVDLPRRMDRMQQRRAGFYARLVLWQSGGESVERECHRRYWSQRVGASGDWFWVAGPLLDALTEVEVSSWR
jgi:hypothetical protein